jgi:predicted small metal-binding protein
MAYSIKCADAGVDCPGSFTTETKEELMKHVELHAKEAIRTSTFSRSRSRRSLRAQTRQRAATSGRRRCHPAS